ncbi:MAG: hypothetical protein AABZ60_18420 [Planctomycetota bacterium]
MPSKLENNKNDKIQELLNELVKQNILLGQRIDSTNQRIDVTLQEILAQSQKSDARIDAAHQRIDATLQEIRAQSIDIFQQRKEWEYFKQEVFPMLERLPDAVKDQIGFKKEHSHKS